MIRRMIGPVTGPILFFLVAGLVFAGLGWVTVAALGVEQAQREAALRADTEKDLRIALWRLDGRMLPALGVEDNRPFDDYISYLPPDPDLPYKFVPTSAPLLAADLPDWMRLHFQLEAETGWESPQVLTSPVRLALRRDWPTLSLGNATSERSAALRTLREQHPARLSIDVFAARDRAVPSGAPPLVAPFFIDGTPADAFTGPPELSVPPSDAPAPAPTAPVPTGTMPPVVAPLGAIPTAEARRNEDRGNGRQKSEAETQIAPETGTPLKRARDAELAATAQSAPAPRPTEPKDNAKSYQELQNGDGYSSRSATIGRGGVDAKKAGDRSAYQNQAFGYGNGNGFVLPQNTPNFGRPFGNSLGLLGGGGIAGGFGGGTGSAGKPTVVPGAPGGTPLAAATPAPAERFAKGMSSPAKPMGDAADKSFAFKDAAPAKKSEDKLADGIVNGNRNYYAGVPVEKPYDFSDAKKADARGLGRLIEEYKEQELLRKQSGAADDRTRREKEHTLRSDAAKELKDLLPPKPPGIAGLEEAGRGGAPAPGPGGPPPAGRPAPVTLKDLNSAAGGSGPRPSTTGPAVPAAPPVRTIAPPAASAPAGGAPPAVSDTKFRALAEPVPPTPNPMRMPELEPVAPPPAPPAVVDEMLVAGGELPPPIAVHLGSMRPQWLTAADGAEVLVLARAARLENKKTIYQGVVLDWSKIQEVLKDEVKDLFPEAKLVPVKDPAAAAREHTMTALPVQLDPGPTPVPPPAGWTPLRIGLVLAWVAALIAFAAVGLCGWSLVDLAERRIRFVSAVTHELRTPLTSLRLYLDLLLSGMVQDEEKRNEYLSTLNVESDRLHRLIDNVLDYARLERRRKGKDLQAVKAADLLETVRRTWTERCGADGRELVVISTLPPEQDVTTDPVLVQQIVGNLIDNAKKYTKEASDTRIWLWAKLDGPRTVVFEVEDRGPGVPTREQKLIFRPFRRGETADTKAGGAGLGLALSKQWAEVLGGSLTYRTPDGGIGSCFRLELRVG